MIKLFEKYKLEVAQKILEKVKSATTNVQQAELEDICFYRLFENEKSNDALRERLLNSSPGLLVLSTKPSFKPVHPYVVLSYDKFYEFQKELVQIIFPNRREVKLLGVTGTNGKSTVVHLCNEIIKFHKKKSFTIGTLGIFDDEEELLPNPGATTPSFLDLCRILHQLSSYDFACLEISSHALDQNRLGDLELMVTGWTNITQDHLDYHGSMKAYFEAKAKILKYGNGQILLSPDEKILEELLEADNLAYKTVKLLSVEKLGDAFKLHYNRKNLSLALGMCEKILLNDLQIPRELNLPKGRYNTFRFNKSVFVVDYAHTPDALLNVTRETKKAFPNALLITVFGCGGDRDKLKRPKMLTAALEVSDRVVVTTDNPRSENPNDIIEDIVDGCSDLKRVKIITNRALAIKDVIADYPYEAVVIIAGKGHEEYQDIKGVKIFFSDIQEVNSAMRELK